MPNVIARFARYLMRSRKRSASLQNGVISPHADSHATSQPAQQRQSATKDDALIKQKAGCEHDEPVAPDRKNENKNNEEPSCENAISSPQSVEVEVKSKKTKTNTVTFKITSDIPQSSTVRNRRVMRELQYMTKATSLPDSPFQISLVDDSNIFEWDVRLLKVDETSELWKSMQDTGTESIRFRLSFPELFPFQPPFLRLVGPYLDNGFIMDGGAICMEVLTSQGWSSAYTVESLLVQVASGLTQGGAVVSRRQKRRYNQLSQRRAEVEFRRICKIHGKYGWVNMERDDA